MYYIIADHNIISLISDRRESSDNHISIFLKRLPPKIDGFSILSRRNILAAIEKD